MNLSKIATDYIESVCRKFRSREKRGEFRIELTDHILQSVEDLMSQSGLSQEEAELAAINQMGPASDISKRMNRVYNPPARTALKYTFLAFTVFLGYLILAPYFVMLFSLPHLPLSDLLFSMGMDWHGNSWMSGGIEGVLATFLFPAFACITGCLFAWPSLKKGNQQAGQLNPPEKRQTDEKGCSHLS